MATERCCCGIELRSNTTVEIIRKPCQCKSPGPGRRQGKCSDLPDDIVTPRQYEQRKRLGLPVLAPSEKETKWV
jgi:hypothetical protein